MVNLTVRATTVEGESWEVVVDHQDTLDSLREKLQPITGREAQYMRFFHPRKGLLEPEKTFEEYNVRPNSILDLILRFGGSAPLGGLPLPDPVEWYNDPIPELLITKYKPDKDALFEQMIAEMEAKLNQEERRAAGEVVEDDEEPQEA